MGTITIQCPHCGTSLQIDENKPLNFCENCGGQLSDASAPRMETGSSEPDIAEKLTELKEAFSNLGRYETAARNQVAHLSQVNAKEQTFIRSKGSKTKGWPIAIAIFSWLILLLFKAGIVGWIIMAVVVIALFPLFGLLYESQCKSIAAQVDKSEGNLQFLTDKLEEYKSLMNKYPDVKIPAKFQNERAIAFMINALTTSQAETLEEAIALCERPQGQNGRGR